MFDVDVGRQHQDGDVVPLLPDGLGRIESLVSCDRGIRMSRLADHLELGSVEQAGQALAQ